MEDSLAALDADAALDAAAAALRAATTLDAAFRAAAVAGGARSLGRALPSACRAVVDATAARVSIAAGFAQACGICATGAAALARGGDGAGLGGLGEGAALEDAAAALRAAATMAAAAVMPGLAAAAVMPGLGTLSGATAGAVAGGTGAFGTSACAGARAGLCVPALAAAFSAVLGTDAGIIRLVCVPPDVGTLGTNALAAAACLHAFEAVAALDAAAAALRAAATLDAATAGIPATRVAAAAVAGRAAGARNAPFAAGLLGIGVACRGDAVGNGMLRTAVRRTPAVGTWSRSCTASVAGEAPILRLVRSMLLPVGVWVPWPYTGPMPLPGSDAGDSSGRVSSPLAGNISSRRQLLALRTL